MSYGLGEDGWGGPGNAAVADPAESEGGQGARRLAVVSQWFPPEGYGAPLWICEALRDMGFRVGVVTGVPHYPSGIVAQGYSPTDWKLDREGGFPVLRVPEFPSHDTSALRRTGTFASFAIAGAVLASRTIARADVALVYSSPATAAMPAMAARLRSGTPYVLLIQDLWPDSVFATGFLHSPARAVFEPPMNSFIEASYRGASHICVITPGMRRALVARGVPPEKITVVFNWVDESVLRPAQPSGELHQALGISHGSFVALFAGNAGEAQALFAWVDAIKRLSDLPSVHLAILGGGTQRDVLRAQSTRLGVSDRVHFLDSVPVGSVPSLVADADVSVVSLAARPLFDITLPSKLQATLAMASPVIASCSGDVAEVVHDSGGGWLARPEDPASIADALRAAFEAGSEERSRRGQRGYDFYQRNMSQATGSRRLAEVLHAVAGGYPRQQQNEGRPSGIQRLREC